MCSENRGALGWEMFAADVAEIDAILARRRCLLCRRAI
jgi:hypothetical protein